MSASPLSITFHLEIFGRHVTLSQTAPPTETLGAVALKLLKDTGIGDSLSGWEILRDEGDHLSADQKIGELFRDSWSGTISVTLRLKLPAKGMEPAAPPPVQKRSAPVTQLNMRLPADIMDQPTLPDFDLEESAKSQKPSNGREKAASPPPAPEAKKPPSVAKLAPKPVPPAPEAKKPPSVAKPAPKPLPPAPEVKKPPSVIKPAPPAPEAKKPASVVKPAPKPVPPPPAAPKKPASVIKPGVKPVPPPPPSPRVPTAGKPASPPPPAATPPRSPASAPRTPTTPPRPSAPAAGAAPAEPPRKKAALTRIKPGITLPAGDGKQTTPPGLIPTQFDIPPMEVEAPPAPVPAAPSAPGPETEAAIELLRDNQETQGRAAATLEALRRERTAHAADEDDDAVVSVAAAGAPRPRRRDLRTGTRRATVRYYNRMNPQRVFPLLVVISKQMIERIAKKKADQRQSGPLKVDLDSAIEVEPILPGCDCYPPKATARLGSDDLTLTFRVVPHVLGEVPGACVLIRQDHANLATIDLDVRVSQRTWVLLSGALTVALPFASALARHFNLDFAATMRDPNNLYVVATGLLVNQLPPLGLLALLGGMTGVLYWLTRAKQKETFWEITPISASAKLSQIRATIEKNPDEAAEDLLYLLDAHPDYQEAWLLFADWQFGRGNWQEAVDGYDRAFRLGSADARHYAQATRAALNLHEYAKALHMLYRAKASLTPEEMASSQFEQLWSAARKSELQPS